MKKQTTQTNMNTSPMPRNSRQSRRRHGLILALLAVAAGTLPALAANLRWTTSSSSIVDGAGTWNQGSASSAGAWYDGTSYNVTMQSSDNVTFGGGTSGAAGTVTIGTGGVSPGNITFSNAFDNKGYTLGAIATGPAITMSGGFITNANTSGGANQNVTCPLNGSFTIVSPNKNITLGGNGNQTAINTVTIVSGSSLQLGNNGGVGGLGLAVITNNGTLQWRRDNTVTINVSNVVYGTGSVTFLGDGATYVIYSNLFYTGSTKLSAYKSTSTKCLVQLGGSNVLPTNTALIIAQNASPTNFSILDLNGFNQTLGSLASDANATATAEVVTNGSATPVTLTLGGTSVATTYGGMIGGGLSLVLNGTGSTLTLSNASTYTGSTTISNGTLKLTASSSLATPAINLAVSGTIFDVSTVTGGYTLGNGQTLSGIGVATGAVTTASASIIAPGNTGSVGTLNFSNNLTLNGNLVFKLNKSLAQSNDIIQVSGSINNTGTGTLTVNNLGPVPVAGDKFILFSSAVVNGGALTIASSAGSTFANNLAVNGSITVLTGHANTNALLSSLVVTPAGTLSPAFTPTGFTYLATNSTGQTPTITVANADLTATNTLFYNGISQGTLASGVPSGALSLSAGTNVVQVLVTAQDGVTTNLYTVNVIGLPRNLTWTTNNSAINDGPGTWNQSSASVTIGSGAWYDGTSYGQMMKNGDNVIIGGGTAGAAGTITNGPGLTPGNLTFTTPSSGDYTIGTNGLGVTGNPITMNGGLITNTSSSSSPTINCPINGSFTYGAPNKNIVFGGNGNQTPANTVTIVSGSTIQLGNNSGAGSVGAAIITNNGTLQWRRNGASTINVSNVVYGTGGMLILGDGATYVIYSNLFYTGSTKLSAYNSTSTKCLVQLGGNNVLPTNTALIIAQNASPTNFSILDLNGFNQTLGSLASDANATATAEVVTNGSSTPATLTLGGTSVTTTYGGMIGGDLSLVLNGSGSTLTLSNANTYTGNTTVSAGTLALKGGGSIAGTPIIGITNGAIFNVSGLTTPFTLGASQTLTNTGTGAIINGTNNCSAGTVSLVYDGVNPSFTQTNGGMTISSSTTIKVNNTGSALTAGSYKLIAKATSGNVGLVAGTVPSVTLGGTGKAGGTGTPVLRIDATTKELYLDVPPAALTLGNNGPICAGSTLNLTANTVSGGTYAWTGPSFTSSSQNPSIANATTAASGTYHCTVTVNGVTSADATTAVTVNALPSTSAITGTNSVQQMTSATYSVANTAGSSYGWTVPAGASFTGGTANSINVTFGTTSGNVSVMETNSSGCTGAVQSEYVTVITCTTPDATVTSATNSVCAGSTGNTASAPTGADTYAWSISGGTITAGANTHAITYTAGGAGTLTLTCAATNGGSCYDVKSANVTVNALPTTGSITGTNLVTHGTTNTYSVTTNAGSTYGWSVPANASYTGGTGNSIDVTFSTNSGSVSVIETNSSGCTGTPVTLAVTVTNHAPVANTMNVLRTPGETVLIALTDLATNWSDPDGDAVRMTAFNGVTTNGVNLTDLYLTTTNDWSVTTYLTAAGGLLGYTNNANINDQFSYSIADGYGGTNVGTVNIVVDPFVSGQVISGQQTTNSITNTTFTVTYYGIPGYTYLLERSTNLTDWVDIATNTIGSGGVTNVIDNFGDIPGGHPSSAYYRVGWKTAY